MKNVMRRKTVLLLTAVALLLTVTVGGTIAYLFTSTGEVVNTFEPTSVTPGIEEDFDGKTKKNVRIQNTGNVPAYIRVAIIGNWVDGDDKVVQTETISVTADGWFTKNGYHYYSSPVVANGHTGYLIGSTGYTPGDKPEGADHFEMQILAQAIQAEGFDVDTNKHPVELAWGVKVNNNDTSADYSDDTISAN